MVGFVVIQECSRQEVHLCLFGVSGMVAKASMFSVRAGGIVGDSLDGGVWMSAFNGIKESPLRWEGDPRISTTVNRQ